MDDKLYNKLHEAQSELSEAFTAKDVEHLAALTPEQRAQQHAARWALHNHIDKIWDAPHLRSRDDEPNHPNHVVGFEGVAVMRDLLSDLLGNLERVQHDAGDDEGVRADIVVRADDDEDD